MRETHTRVASGLQDHGLVAVEFARHDLREKLTQERRAAYNNMD